MQLSITYATLDMSGGRSLFVGLQPSAIQHLFDGRSFLWVPTHNPSQEGDELSFLTPLQPHMLHSGRRNWRHACEVWKPTRAVRR